MRKKKQIWAFIFDSKLFTDPMLVMQVAEQTDSESFKYNIYSTVVTAFTYVFPILILPLALPIATLRTCISRQCCVPRYKQPIGELIMTSFLCLIYLGTLVGVVLPTLAPMLSQAGIEVSGILKIKNIWYCQKDLRVWIFIYLNSQYFLCIHRLSFCPKQYVEII